MRKIKDEKITKEERVKYFIFIQKIWYYFDYRSYDFKKI